MKKTGYDILFTCKVSKANLRTQNSELRSVGNYELKRL